MRYLDSAMEIVRMQDECGVYYDVKLDGVPAYANLPAMVR